MELKYKIEELISQGADDFKISKLIKEDIKEYLNSLDEIFTKNHGKDFLVKHTKKIDYFILLLYKYTVRKFFGDYLPFVNHIPITITAMGSYGREELCVYSDIDLMIVYKNIDGYNLEPIIKSILYLAWDAGLKLGHRVHKVNELFDASNSDLTIKTAMIESRFLCGSRFLWVEIANELQKISKHNLQDFTRELTQSYYQRREKYSLKMEPDIKNGIGGLRASHTIKWLSRAILNSGKLKELVPLYISEKEFKEFRVALEFLYKVRIALHLSAKKNQDVLVLEYIPDIAKKLGFHDKKYTNAQMQLCKKTFSSLHTLDITCHIFLKKLVSPYFFDKNSISKLRNNQIEKGVYKQDNLIVAKRGKKPSSLLHVIQGLSKFDDKNIKFDISYVDYIRKATFDENNSESLYKAFKKLFINDNLYEVFLTLYNANLLRQLVKPFSHIKHLAQFDGYHQYPVDKHSLLGLYFLENIKEPFIQALYDDLCGEGKALIKLVIFMHDIGKGRLGDHSEIGARLFGAYAPKLGFSTEAIRIGTLLIKHHTLMSNTAYREDIYNEYVILAFASAIEKPEALRLLYILTYCDLNAVGENIYTGFNAKLLRELYNLTSEMIDKKELIGETKRRLRKEAQLKRNEEFLSFSKMKQRKILSISSNYFFIKHKPHQILKIVSMAKDAKPYQFTIENESHLSISIVRSKELNISYLLGKLRFLDLINMDIVKLFDDKKYFKIDFNKKVDKSDIPFLEDLIKSSFDMTNSTTLCKPIIRENEIAFDNRDSKSLVKLSIDTTNQKGLMAYTMSVLNDNGIRVSTAKIQTIKNRARNLFLIEKTVNLCDNENKILELLITR